MPYEAPGKRYVATATKAVNHGEPAVENNHAGVAAKSEQPPPMAVSIANAAIAQQIAIGEQFVIQMTGDHEVAVAALPVGAAAGTQLWIDPSDNTLADAAATGLVKFGLVDDIDATRAIAHVNLDQRSSF